MHVRSIVTPPSRFTRWASEEEEEEVSLDLAVLSFELPTTQILEIKFKVRCTLSKVINFSLTRVPLLRQFFANVFSCLNRSRVRRSPSGRWSSESSRDKVQVERLLRLCRVNLVFRGWSDQLSFSISLSKNATESSRIIAFERAYSLARHDIYR